MAKQIKKIMDAFQKFKEENQLEKDIVREKDLMIEELLEQIKQKDKLISELQ